MTFKYKVSLVKGMKLTTFRIDETQLSKEELKPNNENVIEGEIDVMPLFNTVAVSLWGVGSSFLNGTFNISYNGKNLFEKDENLRIKAGGRFRFYKKEVKIPF